MAIRYDIQHTTIYRYSQPVSFGLHRIMFRPRDSHDLRVLATNLDVSPEADVRMIQDPHSNSIALVKPLAWHGLMLDVGIKRFKPRCDALPVI